MPAAARVWHWAKREPLLPFLAVGLALFALYAGVQPRGDRAEPSASPLDRRIVVDDELIARLRDKFQRAWRRAPTREELGEILFEEIGEEALYREAVAARLDRDDVVVRKRLVEKMVLLERGTAPVGDPSDAEVRRHFEEHRHRYVTPTQVSFDQVFFDARVRGGQINAAAAAVLAELRSQPDSFASRGDPSPLPRAFEDLSALQVAQLFGDGFARSLLAATPSTWQGPVSSRLGLHVVRVRRVQLPHTPAFEDVAGRVRADLLTERNRGQDEAARAVLPRFDLRVSPGARAAVEGAPLARPLLERR